MTPEQFAKLLTASLQWGNVNINHIDDSDLSCTIIDGNYDMLKVARRMLRFVQPVPGILYIDGEPSAVSEEPTSIKGTIEPR